MHYYQFNIGDYASHTQHLDPLEDIAYRRMLDWCYLNEMPLPDDIGDIARLIRMRSHTDCIAIVLREFFERNADGYTHARVSREVDAYREKSDKAKKSAEARWKKKPSNHAGSVDANALRPECEGIANHKPLTINQEPLTNSIGAFAPEKQKSTRFVAPTVDQVREYCLARRNQIDPQKFIDHYSANGWMRGKTKIKDWKACVRTWEGNQQAGGLTNGNHRPAPKNAIRRIEEQARAGFANAEAREAAERAMAEDDAAIRAQVGISGGGDMGRQGELLRELPALGQKDRVFD